MLKLALISLLLLAGCTETRVGARYLVTSGFWKGCTGEARSSYTWMFQTRTMLNLECKGNKSGLEFFSNSELEEVNGTEE